MVQQIWAKFNPNERMIATGAVVVIVGWIIGLISPYGVGANALALIAALAALAVLYLEYAPNTNVNWPAPTAVILLAVSVIGGIFALLGLTWLGIGGLYLIAALATIIGAALMVWGSFQEWQASQKTA
ncbi:MAG TPA: hypothetical protein VGK63_06405 [Candidatus Limnocylindrales bacterium]